ncbi:hypothetical protein [Burkholderia multivorans]|uniref:Bacteriophage protein n=1 Tax=Burkholderia multivorans (strain ATCC 17616 / 249) TaxID=395019 RepID=A0A0H3KEL0_BURM1|nr:hypothetical protein [Burkholderia multivorans]ABX15542.1 hypothetical protein Bmul_1855 [Burkholderia multivorans ATCC 17616]PRF51360.1 hypothetical protein C6Q28_29475 [Burkholderia multivorans]BAG43323.1 putative bacteriophage protein [Burkholderia multivorans ATCC 17616]
MNDQQQIRADALTDERRNGTGAEVAQWQMRLKDRSSPVVDHWVNISPDGAKTLMEKYADVYEVRALYAAPQHPAQANALPEIDPPQAGGNKGRLPALARTREGGNLYSLGYNRGLKKGRDEAAQADAPAEAREPHSDDVAVDSFATAMKHKLALARAKGRGGWETCSPADLSRMLREHVEKGDPRDVANFCMMLWHHGSPIASAPADSEAARLTDEQRRVLVEVAQTFKGTDRRRAVLNELAGVAAPQPAQAETPCKCRRVGDWRGFHHPLCDASTPAQADARVGLTDEQIDEIARPFAGLGGIEDYRAFARALLAAHPGQPEPRGAAQVPCPICGGEAVDHLDVLERVTIAPEPRAEVTDWNTPCTGCATPRACQYDGCRKEPRAEVTGDTVLVPKRVVELLRIINRDGIIKRASELQEVYRLVEAARAQGGES